MKSGAGLRRQLLLIVVIICAVFAFHSSFLSAGFYLDDFEYIESLTSSSFTSVFSPFQKFFYRPVFLAWLWMFFHTFGVSAVPLHAANMVLYALVVYLLGVLVLRITQSRKTAVLAALLFFLWPHKNQAIWWISCASTQLAALFFLTTLICWHGYRTNGGRGWYLGALASFMLSLGSKEDAHALPFVLMAFEVYLLSVRPVAAAGEKKKWDLRIYAPFAIGLGAYLTCDVIALMNSAFAQAYATVPRNRFVSVLSFAQSIWPFSSLAPGAPLGHVWTLAFIAAAVWLGRQKKLAMFALFWLLVHCLFIGAEASPSMLGSERFVFLPALPASLLLALALVTAWRAREQAPILCVALTVATALVFSPIPLMAPSGAPALILAAGLLAALVIIGRSGRVPTEAALLGGSVLLLEIAFSLWGGGQWGLYPALSIVIGAAIMARKEARLWWQGALAGLLLWETPLYSGILFVVVIAWLPQIEARATALYLRWREAAALS